MNRADAFYLVFVALAVALMIWGVRARRKSYAKFLSETSVAEVCEHLRPAFELLRERGHRVDRIGQKAPDLPLEIHLTPPFDPQGVYDGLKLAPPVYVSERNVLYCKDDWCEIHPIKA